MDRTIQGDIMSVKMHRWIRETKAKTLQLQKRVIEDERDDCLDAVVFAAVNLERQLSTLRDAMNEDQRARLEWLEGNDDVEAD